MDITQFMRGYKAAWENRDEARFVALFTADGEYHNTPFAVQRGPAQLAEYWRRVKLQEDVRVDYEVLSATATGGIMRVESTQFTNWWRPRKFMRDSA